MKVPFYQIRERGRIAKATPKDEVAQAEGSPAFQAYLSEMEGNIDALQSDVELRDEQIDALKAKLDALLNGEGKNQERGGGAAFGSEATTQLIAMLKEQIKQLEEEKRASDAEDQKQNALIAAQAGQLNAQAGKLSAQEGKITAQEGQLMTQQGEISELRNENQSLRKNMAAIMKKLGMK